MWRQSDLDALLAKGDVRLAAGGTPAEPPALSEKAFQAGVMGLARSHGWMAYHTWTSKRSPAGFPDLCLAREALLFAELKLPGEHPSEAQRAWLTALKATGACEVYLWYPSHIDEIRARLTRRVRHG